MSSKALEKFNKTINRCENLVKNYQIIHDAFESHENITLPKDILRGAVVLSVSALDAYVTEVFTEKLVPYLKKYKPDEGLINLLSDAGLDTKEALNLITMERPYRRIRTLIQQYYQKYTTQQFDIIDKIFLHYRIKNISDNAEKMSGRRTLKRSVNLLIKRRHKIAHSGDYNYHGRITNIDENQIVQRIKDLEIIVNHMDKILCNRI